MKIYNNELISNTMGIIYKITNLVNNKIYIGKRLWTEQEFFGSTYYGGGKLIGNAIKKYGKENFKREILLICNKEEIDNKEKEYIKLYDSKVPKGYNIGDGGEGNNGGQNKGRKMPWASKNGFKKGQKPWNYGLTKKTDKRIGINHWSLNEVLKQKTIKKISDKHKNKTLSLLHKKSISKGMKNLYKKGYINNRKGVRKNA